MNDTRSLKLVVIEGSGKPSYAVETNSLSKRGMEFTAAKIGGLNPTPLGALRIYQVGPTPDETVHVMVGQKGMQVDYDVPHVLVASALCWFALQEGAKALPKLYAAAQPHEAIMLDAYRKAELSPGTPPIEFKNYAVGDSFLRYRDDASWFGFNDNNITSRARYLLGVVLDPEKQQKNSVGQASRAVIHLRIDALRKNSSEALRTLAGLRTSKKPAAEGA